MILLLQAKEGELMHYSGTLMKKWQKAYFSVKDGFLELSKTKVHEQMLQPLAKSRCNVCVAHTRCGREQGSKLVMRIPMLDCELYEHQDKNQKFAFSVTTTKKRLILAASELEDMHAWMNALLKVKQLKTRVLGHTESL